MKYSFRIDPAQDGIHIVDVENGGERVFIPKKDISKLIKFLGDVLQDDKFFNL